MSGLAPPDGSRALFFACAVACFLAAAAAVFAGAAATAARAGALQTASALTVRILSPDDPAAAARAAEALRRAPGVVSAEAVGAERARALASRWGAALAPEALTALRLIEARAAFGRAGDPLLAPELEAALARGGFEAEVLAAGPAADAALAEAARVERLALWAMAAAALCAAMIVGFIARARAAARGEAVRVMAEIGATEGQAAGPFAEEAAGSAFAAGVAGAVLAAGAAAAVLPLAAPGLTVADMLAFAGPLDYAPLAATPLIAAVAAGVGARSGAARAYRRSFAP